MNSKLLLSAIAVVIIIAGCAKVDTSLHDLTERTQLTIEDACSEVQAFFAHAVETKSYVLEPRTIESWWITSVSTKSESIGSSIIVLNFADSLGFAIVSSNPQFGLLGVALKGSLNEDSEIDNPGLSIVLSNIESFVCYADSLDVGVPTESYVYHDWVDTYYSPINGYCPVLWGQSSPYNEYCFTQSGLQAVTGCVATASAQLMAIYQYPLSYSGFSYDWEEMIDSPYWTNAQGRRPVASLMRQLGNSGNLNMDYQIDNSEANIGYVPRTLENFGYVSGGVAEDLNYDAVISDLRSGYPVILGGSPKRITTTERNFWGSITNVSYSYEFGHCWIGHGLLTRRRNVDIYIDGVYDSTGYELRDYILCNFGDEGDGDGYYSPIAFTRNIGPVFSPPITRSVTQTVEFEPDNYRFNMCSVTGIRQ